MKDFLTFLQIVQILGKWVWNIFYKYHITSAVILAFLLITWPSNPERGYFGVIFFSLVLFQWIYRNNKKRTKLELSNPIINIENKNILSVQNSNKRKDQNN